MSLCVTFCYYKFKLGSVIQEKQTKIQARIIEINYKKHTYKLKFGKDNNFKIEEYDSFDIEKFWELKENVLKSCTCGMWKVHGKNCPISFHSQWCDIRIKS